MKYRWQEMDEGSFAEKMLPEEIGQQAIQIEIQDQREFMCHLSPDCAAIGSQEELDRFMMARILTVVQELSGDEKVRLIKKITKITGRGNAFSIFPKSLAEKDRIIDLLKSIEGLRVVEDSAALN